MLKLRASDLDSWVRFVEGDDERSPSQTEFIADLLRLTPPNENMLAGTAFHDVLEHARIGEIGRREDGAYPMAKGFTFDFEQGDFVVTLPPKREGFIEKAYQTSVGPVLLRGRFDGRDRFTITDYKLTFSAFDAERYATSLQWKAYLDMTGASRFQYEVFTASIRDGHITLKEQHGLTFWRYLEMEEDVRRRVDEMASFMVHYADEIERVRNGWNQCVEIERKFEEVKNNTLRSLQHAVVID